MLDGEDNELKLSVRNYHLDESTTKALACLLPYLVEVHELELFANQINDHVAAALLFGFFMNPKMHKLTISKNYMRGAFSKTLALLART